MGIVNLAAKETVVLEGYTKKQPRWRHDRRDPLACRGRL